MMTPIQKVFVQGSQNEIYVKREDLLPFSFGGNKIRIAWEFFADMKRKGKDCIVGYGNARSNLARALANLGSSGGVPCYLVSPVDDDGSREWTANSRIAGICGAYFRHCAKGNVAETVESVLEECRGRGWKPYYIYGDKYGKGNEAVPVNAYAEAYGEIRRQERELGVQFDYIFLASGTGMTQGGLAAGQRKIGGQGRVVGISVARPKEKVVGEVRKYVEAYVGGSVGDLGIHVLDGYLAGGYGAYNAEIIGTVRTMMERNGIPLDTTYTGKAFWGMCDYMKESGIKNKNILFIHTGGTPLFFDKLDVVLCGRGADGKTGCRERLE